MFMGQGERALELLTGNGKKNMNSSLITSIVSVFSRTSSISLNSISLGFILAYSFFNYFLQKGEDFFIVRQSQIKNGGFL